MKIAKHVALAIGLLASAGIAACSSTNPVLRPGPAPSPAPTVSVSSPVLNVATQYTQIERLSRPAIKEVFESFQQHQISNGVEPYNDTTIQNAIKTTEDTARPPNSAKGTDYGMALQSVLYPDQYLVNLNGTAPASGAADPELFLSAEVDGSSAFGGRAPNDDVIALELGALFGKTLSEIPALGVADDGEENNCLQAQNVVQASTQASTTTFPYLPAPQ